MKQTRVLCTGAGGFIGGHLVKRLKQEGYWVRGVDLKQPEWSPSPADEFRFLDLRFAHDAAVAVQDIDWVFHLAADMGGMQHIVTETYKIIRNNTLIDAHVLDEARAANVKRLLYSSSACVYPCYKQSGKLVYEQKDERSFGEFTNVPFGEPLKESDVYPAQPQESYGWQKLHTEHMCNEYRKAGVLNARSVRFHACYGPEGAWRGGREKAPAALSRKVAISKLIGIPRVEIWGDGRQVRSFMYVDDCVEGLVRIMNSDHPDTLNLGSNETISIDSLVDLIAGIAGIGVEKVHVEGPQGVRWRNSDNSLCFETLGWTPGISLEWGMKQTYTWVEEQVGAALERGDPL